MKLSEYIKDFGALALAEQLQIDVSTVYKWRNLDSAPTPENANQIVKFTRGLVNYSDIYDPFFEKTKADNNQLSFDLK